MSPVGSLASSLFGAVRAFASAAQGNLRAVGRSRSVLDVRGLSHESRVDVPGCDAVRATALRNTGSGHWPAVLRSAIWTYRHRFQGRNEKCTGQIDANGLHW